MRKTISEQEKIDLLSQYMKEKIGIPVPDDMVKEIASAIVSEIETTPNGPGSKYTVADAIFEKKEKVNYEYFQKAVNTAREKQKTSRKSVNKSEFEYIPFSSVNNNKANVSEEESKKEPKEVYIPNATKASPSVQPPKKNRWIVTACTFCVLFFASLIAIAGLYLKLVDEQKSVKELQEKVAESINTSDNAEGEDDSDLEKKYETLKNAYDKLMETHKNVKANYSALKNNYDDLKMKDNFYDRSIVIVGTDEYYYHKYGCSYLDDSEYLAFNIDNAEYQGYVACPHCCN